MRPFLRLAFCLLLAAFPSWAHASFDSSRAWFEALPAPERAATQANLILLGHYDFLVDGQFGRATYDAVAAFQQSQGRAGTGVLDAAELAGLRRLAADVDRRLGLEDVTDRAGHVELSVPTRLLPIRTPTGLGTTYASEDGELSLETMYASLAEQSFAELYDSLLNSDDERTITYRTFSDRRFVVSGMLGDYTYYTMFVNGGADAVGYSLAWARSYQREGALPSTHASHATVA